MSNIPSTISVSDARSNLYDLIDEVSSKLRRFVITHKGQEKAVIMPIEDVESWEETLEIMSNPKLYKSIKKAQKEISQGKAVPFEEVLKKFNL